MEWLEYLKLGRPLTINEACLLMWFWGAIFGYCLGRAHAVWIQLGRLTSSINKTLDNLNKGDK